MIGIKTCPHCLKVWTSAFNFCPKDGAELHAVDGAILEEEGFSPEEHVKDLKATRALRAPKLESLNVGPPLAVPEEPAPPPASQGPTTEPLPKELKPSSRKSPKPSDDSAEERPRRALRMAETIMVSEAISEEDIRQDLLNRQSDKTAESEALEDAENGAAKEAPAGKAPRKSFSETQWFKAIPDEALIDPSTGKVRLDPEQYRPDDGMTDEERRRYSLNDSKGNKT